MKTDSSDSKQLVDEGDALGNDGMVMPFFSPQGILDLYYASVYHRRALQVKALLLSRLKNPEALLKKIPEDQSASDWLYAFLLDWLIFGNAYIEDQTGTWHNFPAREARINKERKIFQLMRDGKKQGLEGYHFKNHSPSSRFYGEPDYLAALPAISLASRADTYNIKFFDNGAQPGFAILFEGEEPGEEQLSTFKTFFSENFKGSENAHRTLVVSTGKDGSKVRLEPLSRVEDQSFTKLKQTARDEVIAAHGVPPRLVGVMDAGGLGGGGEFTSQLHGFNQLTLKPNSHKISAWFKRLGVDIEIEELDISSFKDDADLIPQLIDRGVLSLNEAKNILGYGE